MSLLLDRLEAQFSCAGTMEERAIVLARKAAYLARIGRFDEARSIVAAVREAFSDGRSGRATAWLMWTEGLIHFYFDLNPNALDRVARAQLLAMAMRDKDLTALSSSWKAHMEFETSRFAAMGDSLRTAQVHVSPENHSAVTRLCMVVADALFLCGDHVNGQRWFMRGRDSALDEGDQASIEALVYNRAAFRLAWLRAQRCMRELSHDETGTVRKEVESACNLQDLTQVRALPDIVRLCEARAIALDGQFDVALAKLTAIQDAEGPFAHYNFSQAFVALEIAYCHARLGNVEAATSITDRLHDVHFSQLDVDEQLVACWMRREMAAIDGSFGSLTEAQEQLDKSVGAYIEWIVSIEKSIDSVRVLVPSRTASQ